jgi:hypothetical protein
MRGKTPLLVYLLSLRTKRVSLINQKTIFVPLSVRLFRENYDSKQKNYEKIGTRGLALTRQTWQTGSRRDRLNNSKNTLQHA